MVRIGTFRRGAALRSATRRKPQRLYVPSLFCYARTASVCKLRCTIWFLFFWHFSCVHFCVQSRALWLVVLAVVVVVVVVVREYGHVGRDGAIIELANDFRPTLFGGQSFGWKGAIENNWLR